MRALRRFDKDTLVTNSSHAGKNNVLGSAPVVTEENSVDTVLFSALF